MEHVSDSGSISGFIFGCFTGFGNINVSSSISYSFDTTSTATSSFTFYDANGLIAVKGVNRLIISMSIVGNFSGSISHSIVRL